MSSLAVTIESNANKRHESLRSIHKRLSSKRRSKLLSKDNNSVLDNNDLPVSVNEKQNMEFHELFKSVPEDDELIESFACALRKHILHQGRLFISEHFICFKSNLFGVVTNLVINLDEIKSVDKRMTAKIIPNRIVITTETSIHTFASFLTRDQAFDQIVKIWDLHQQAAADKKDRESALIAVAPTIPSANKISIVDHSLKDPQHLYHLSKLTKYDMHPSIYKRLPKVCTCVINEDIYSHVAVDNTFPGTVETMANVLFKSVFIKSFLERYGNMEDVEVGEWRHDHRLVTGKRTTGTRVQLIDKKIHKKMPYYYCFSTTKSIGTIYSTETHTTIRRVTEEKVNVRISFQVIYSKSGLTSTVIENQAVEEQLRVYRQLNSVLNKPEFVRELLNADKEVGEEEKEEEKQLVTIEKESQTVQWVYFVMLFVIVTHCILVLRLQHISHSLDWTQQDNNRGLQLKQRYYK